MILYCFSASAMPDSQVYIGIKFGVEKLRRPFKNATVDGSVYDNMPTNKFLCKGGCKELAHSRSNCNILNECCKHCMRHLKI